MAAFNLKLHRNFNLCAPPRPQIEVSWLRSLRLPWTKLIYICSITDNFTVSPKDCLRKNTIHCMPPYPQVEVFSGGYLEANNSSSSNSRGNDLWMPILDNYRCSSGQGVHVSRTGSGAHISACTIDQNFASNMVVQGGASVTIQGGSCDQSTLVWIARGFGSAGKGAPAQPATPNPPATKKEMWCLWLVGVWRSGIDLGLRNLNNYVDLSNWGTFWTWSVGCFKQDDVEQNTGS